ncbi:hypothetical protein A9267_05955 [Shewanella sp. UCD-FRSSP16_17]|uniref:DUF3592 domain-containing protein n=1 Tax=Shewanella sp. UCD-FRSSP16_17 TaxID=1853256 RepID=UPI0007EEE6CE|nr:DUF3592 domain-containing protein [Shewanella sp. UCD-FRSSP16_17]OBT10419.1 hypothetical protein A9267_05955 [Shewanella sp. UCD-FRSSP16_17]
MQKIVSVLFFIVVGLVMIKSCKRDSDIRSWPSTQGTIVSQSVEQYSEKESYTDRNGKRKYDYENKYRVRIVYQYQVDGFEYNGNFAISDLEMQSEIERHLTSNPNGKLINIKYNPINPADSANRS